MLPILALLAAMARETRPLSALVADLPARTTASDRLAEVDVAACGQLLQALAAAGDDRTALLGAVSATDTLDGVRMTLASGETVHLRLSGNAPELRCYVEAADAERAGALLASVLGDVEQLLRRRAGA
jgi:phosphomannomutase